MSSLERGYLLCVCVCVCVSSVSKPVFLATQGFCKRSLNILLAQPAGAVVYTDLLCKGVRPPPHTHQTSVLDITLNNLMVRFQKCWSFRECRILLHCHRSQFHSISSSKKVLNLTKATNLGEGKNLFKSIVWRIYGTLLHHSSVISSSKKVLNLAETTSLGEGKTPNSKPEECYLCNTI